MKQVLTGAQMKDCDQRTIKEFGVPSPVLMERAALACVEELVQLSYEEDQKILVICGNGNNGGDGIAVARILKERGAEPVLFMAGAELPADQTADMTQRLSADCAAQLRIALAYGVAMTGRQEALSALTAGRFDLVVDAMFGVGLSRPLDKSYREIVEAVNASGAKVLAVDIPTGIHADSGACMGAAVRADVTVTFAFYKRGQLLYPGRSYCGRCVVKDIGITEKALDRRARYSFCYGPEDMRKLPGRKADSNKGTYGKVLMAAGSRKICGAACLSAMAAYRTGAGLVRLLTEEHNRTVLLQSLPEGLFDFYEETSGAGWEASLEELVEEGLSWATVAGAGPGLGRGAQARLIIEKLLEEAAVPVVVDADGLNLLAENPALLEKRRERGAKETEKDLPPLIVTPHLMEMSRLTGKTIEALKQDPVCHALDFAEKYRCVCVLKDACTVVCDDNGSIFLNTSGNSGMSTGGSGDVLTGVICGLLAQKMPAFEAAALGVYLHGSAGDLAAKETGEYGLLARNLLKGIGELTNEQ